MAEPIVASSRRRYCREVITMLGGWEAGIALLLDAGEGGGWGMVWRTPSLPLSPWYAGTLVLTVHFSECNQSVSSSRLNQSLLHHQHPKTHSSLISDQNTARICCCLLCTLIRSYTVWWTAIIMISNRETNFPWQQITVIIFLGTQRVILLYNIIIIHFKVAVQCDCRLLN